MSTWDNPPPPPKKNISSVFPPDKLFSPYHTKAHRLQMSLEEIKERNDIGLYGGTHGFYFSFHFESSKGWACEYRRKIRELILSPLVTWLPTTGVSGLFKGFVTENLSSVVWEFWIDTFLFSVQLLLCWSIQRFSPASCCWDFCLPSSRWFYFIGSKMS